MKKALLPLSVLIFTALLLSGCDDMLYDNSSSIANSHTAYSGNYSRAQKCASLQNKLTKYGDPSNPHYLPEGRTWEQYKAYGCDK